MIKEECMMVPESVADKFKSKTTIQIKYDILEYDFDVYLNKRSSDIINCYSSICYGKTIEKIGLYREIYRNTHLEAIKANIRGLNCKSFTLDYLKRM